MGEENIAPEPVAKEPVAARQPETGGEFLQARWDSALTDDMRRAMREPELVPEYAQEDPEAKEPSQDKWLRYRGQARDDALAAKEEFGEDSEEFKKAKAKWWNRVQMTGMSADIAQETGRAEATEEVLRRAYVPMKRFVGGATFGLGKLALELIEEETGIIVRPESPGEQRVAAFADMVGVVVGMRGLAQGLKHIGLKMGINPATQSLRMLMLVRMGTPLIGSGTRNLVSYARGELDAQTAAGNVAQSFLASLVGIIPEQAITPGVGNFIGQVLADFTFDLISDVAVRDRLKDQTFGEWFFREELVQLGMSVAFAMDDLVDKDTLRIQQAAVRDFFSGHRTRIMADVAKADLQSMEREMQDVNRALDDPSGGAVKPLDTPEPKDMEARLAEDRVEREVLEKSGIPKEDLPDYIASDLADGTRLRDYAADVRAGKMTVEEAAAKAHQDYEKLAAEGPKVSEGTVREWEETRRQIVPEDYMNRTDTEKEEIRATLAEARQDFLKTHPEAALKVESDADGVKEVAFEPTNEFRLKAGDALDVPASPTAQVGEPIFGPPKPLPKQMSENVARVRSAVIAVSRTGDKRMKTLARTIGKALSELMRIQNLTPENASDMVDHVQATTKGVGPSTAALLKIMVRAENSREALKMFNDWRAGTGKDPIEPLEEAPIEARGRMRPEDFREFQDEMIPYAKGMKDQALAEHVYESMVAGLDYDLPKDPQARSALFANYRQLFKEHYEGLAAPKGIGGRVQKTLLALGRLMGSARYNFTSQAQRSGNMGYQIESVKNTHQTLRGRYDAESRLKTNLLEATGFKRWELDYLPERMDAIPDVIGIDPAGDKSIGLSAAQAQLRIETAKADLVDYSQPRKAASLLKKLGGAKTPADAEAIRAELKAMEIPYDDPRNRYRKFAEATKAELQGPSAVNTRQEQVYMWRRAWRQLATQIRALETEKARRKDFPETKQKQLDNLLKDLESKAPSMAGPEGERITVPRQELTKAVGIWETRGENALRAYLATVEWGTRRFYYMAEGEPSDPILGKGFRGARVGVGRRAYSRLGLSDLKKGNFLNDLHRHVVGGEVRARGLESAEKLLRYMAEDETLTPWNRKAMVKNIENSMGLTQDPSDITHLANIANRFFWRAYPLSISRAGFWTLRNIPQNFGVGLSQLGAKNMAISLTRIKQLIKDPNSRIRSAFTDQFKPIIAQGDVMFREAMQMHQPLERGQYKGSPEMIQAMNVLDSLGQAVFRFSDTTINRNFMWLMSYDTADRHLQSYLKSLKTGGAEGIDYRTFRKNLLLANLEPAQENELMRLINQGAESVKGRDSEAAENFAKRYAEIRNENTNFLYRTQGRSGLEQNVNNRPWLGIMTWPRGAAEVLVRNGILPMVEGFAAKDYAKSWTGFKTIGAYMFGMYVAQEIFGTLFGQRGKQVAFNPLYSITRWEPLTPGSSMMLEFSALARLFKQADPYEEDYERAMFRAVEYVGDKALYFVPVLNDMPKWFDAMGDTRGAGNVAYFMDKLRGKIPDVESKEYYSTWHKMFLNTELRPAEETLWYTLQPFSLFSDYRPPG